MSEKFMAEVVGKPKRLTAKIGGLLAAIGPGLFLVGYNIGTGSVTTMAATGAEYGMMLVWPLLLSCVFTFVLIVTFGRFTAITGETALYSFRIHFGKSVALFVLVSILLSEYISAMGVMAVVAQAVQEWSRPLTASGEGLSPVFVALGFGGLLYVLFINGQYRFFEKILTVFVSLMGLSFFATMFMVIPDARAVMRGLVPHVPGEANAALLIAGMVGTTMGAVLYLVRSILVKEKGWSAEDLKLERRDALISSVMMFVLSVAIMASAAGTLHPRGLRVDNVIDMVALLEPLAGRFAISVFVAGIVCAGLSSFFPNVLLGPWLIADYNHEASNLRSTRSRLIALGVVLLGLVVPIFGGRPVLVMVVSQAMLAVTTPLIIFLMMVLQNKRAVMGAHVPGWPMNLTLGFIFLFSVAMAYIGVVGLLGLV